MKHDLPITEQQYFMSNNALLKDRECSNCHEVGGLFTGAFYVGCFNCLCYPDKENERRLRE